MKQFVLQKQDPLKVYFKCFDKTGCTYTSSIDDAKIFNDKNKAIDFNHDRLYGECEVVEKH